MQVVGALVYLSGELYFLNNSGGEESALHMLSFAQIVLSRGLYVNFEGNSGRSVPLCFNPHIETTPCIVFSMHTVVKSLYVQEC